MPSCGQFPSVRQSRSSCALGDAGGEDVVGQLPVGDRAGELQGGDQNAEQVLRPPCVRQTVRVETGALR